VIKCVAGNQEVYRWTKHLCVESRICFTCERIIELKDGERTKFICESNVQICTIPYQHIHICKYMVLFILFSLHYIVESKHLNASLRILKKYCLIRSILMNKAIETGSYFTPVFQLCSLMMNTLLHIPNIVKQMVYSYW